MVAALTRLIMSSGKSVAGFTELLLLKMNSPFLRTIAEVASVHLVMSTTPVLCSHSGQHNHKHMSV
jgi:hypothetical protein